MYLAHCTKNTYFEITEIWFPYDDRKLYSKRGIDEEKIVYVLENNNEQITISSQIQIEDKLETINTTFSYEDSLQIWGNVLTKKIAQNKQKII